MNTENHIMANVILIKSMHASYKSKIANFKHTIHAALTTANIIDAAVALCAKR